MVPLFYFQRSYSPSIALTCIISLFKQNSLNAGAKSTHNLHSAHKKSSSQIAQSVIFQLVMFNRSIEISG